MAPPSATRGPSSASRPRPRPFGFFVAMADCRGSTRRPGRRTRATAWPYAVASLSRDRHGDARFRRRPGRHDRPSHPRVPRPAPRRRGAARRRPICARTAPSAPGCSTPPTSPSSACPTPRRARPPRWSTNPATCLIDASTAHRTAGDWVYGLPELVAGQRARIRASKRIANPGCHATGFILLARPLVDAGLVSSATPLSATSITGYSGGGKKMIEQYEAGGDPRLARLGHTASASPTSTCRR